MIYHYWAELVELKYTWQVVLSVDNCEVINCSRIPLYPKLLSIDGRGIIIFIRSGNIIIKKTPHGEAFRLSDTPKIPTCCLEVLINRNPLISTVSSIANIISLIVLPVSAPFTLVITKPKEKHPPKSERSTKVKQHLHRQWSVREKLSLCCWKI